MPLKVEDFELLLQANRILSSKLEIDDVLRAVLELATKVVNAEASSLLLLDEKKGELYFDVALGEAGEKVKPIRIKVGEGIAGWVALKKKALIVNDVSKDPRFTSRVDKSTKFKTRSILAVPLISKGKLLGVVEALNKHGNRNFDHNDQEAFESFAGQAAVAISNARLFSEVRREKQKLNTVFSQMSDGVVLLDDDRRVIFWNKRAEGFFDFKPGRSENSEFSEGTLLGFESDPGVDSVLSDLRFPRWLEMNREKGKKLCLAGSAHPISATKELPQGGALLIFRDVTEEKAGEMLKKNFLSLISHKLRTPLTVILGYGPALLADSQDLNLMQKKGITAICEQAEQLSRLVEKLLRFTVVESDTVDKKISDVPLRDIVAEGVREVKDAHKKGDLSVDWQMNKKWPLVKADRELTVEVVKNILENGIKFNKAKTPTIKIEFEKKNGKVSVRFIDNGIGVPPEEKEKIFQKFYQVEDSFTGQVPGAGLGLPFSKKVMTSMGGDISLQSTLGKGTRVTLDFKPA